MRVMGKRRVDGGAARKRGQSCLRPPHRTSLAVAGRAISCSNPLFTARIRQEYDLI